MHGLIRDQRCKILSGLIHVQKSKINQPEVFERVEIVDARCECPGPRGPHLVKRLIAMKKESGTYGKKKAFLTFEGGVHIAVNFVNPVLGDIAPEMDLDPELYTSHSGRIGRARDMTANNVRHYHIAKWVRWTKAAWEATNAKIDYSDIAKNHTHNHDGQTVG